MKINFKKNKKKHDKKTRILFIGVVLIIVIIILVIILKSILSQPSKVTVSAIEKLEYINDDSSLDKNTKNPSYIVYLRDAYEGEISMTSVGKSTYYIATEVFPTYYTDLKDSSEEEIIEYYEKNQEAIYINLAIESKTQFVSLVKSIQSLSGESLSFESYRFDKDTIKAGANYTKAVLYITYEGNSELPVNITVKNKVSSDCSSILYRAYEE